MILFLDKFISALLKIVLTIIILFCLIISFHAFLSKPAETIHKLSQETVNILKILPKLNS